MTVDVKSLFPNRILPLTGSDLMENLDELERNVVLLAENGTLSEDETIAAVHTIEATDVTISATDVLDLGAGAGGISNTISANGNFSVNTQGDIILGGGSVDGIYLDAPGYGIRIGDTGDKLAFLGTTPVAKQTGVAVTAAGVHAALVNLGLISA